MPVGKQSISESERKWGWESVVASQAWLKDACLKYFMVLAGFNHDTVKGPVLPFQPTGKGKRLPEVYCIVSHLGCFNLFSKVNSCFSSANHHYCDTSHTPPTRTCVCVCVL